MLNFFYWYAIIFSTVLILYNLNWSDSNLPLEMSLLIFFIITIIVSLILGWLNRHKFVFTKLEKYDRKNRIITYFIIGLYALNFIYGRQIPLFAVLSGTAKYADFRGIPTIYVITVTFTTFYAAYIYYLFICFNKRKYLLIEFVIFFSLQLLCLNRGSALSFVIIAILITLESIKHKIRLKHLCLTLILGLIILYLYGVMGNLRSGYKWNDSSFIKMYGQYNDNYPKFLPQEYMWTYTYITEPLGSFNYNIIKNEDKTLNLNNYIIYSFIPDFISKRFDIIDAKTIYMTKGGMVSGAYLDSYLYGGYGGMYLQYIYFIFIFLIIINITKKIKYYYIPTVAIINFLTLYLFFVNTIVYSGYSFALFYPVIATILNCYPKNYYYSYPNEKNMKYHNIFIRLIKQNYKIN